MRPAVLCFLAVLALGGVALGQRQLVTVELGLASETVADAWNPLRVTLRDQPPVEFVLEIDYGSLREGPRIVRYSTRLGGGSGIRVFEDDVYLPAWRAMTWFVRSESATLASGSFERSRPEAGPLQIVVAGALGAQRALLDPALRTIDLLPSELPERVAAYDGVATLIIDGSAAPPRLEAVATAAAAGAVVVLLEPLAPSHRPLARLAPQRLQRLGAGWLMRASASEATGLGALQGLKGSTSDPLVRALVTPDLREGPAAAPLLNVFLIAGGYSLVVLALVRYAGMPGFLASLALAVIVSLASWSTFRTEAGEALRSRQLLISGGPLTLRQGVQVYFSLSQAPWRSASPGRALDEISWRATESWLDADLGRWQSVAVAQRPALQEASLRWQEGRLDNVGASTLADVYVLGWGAQEGLAPGASLAPVASDALTLPEAYAGLAELLPEGAALARRGEQIHVALPQPAADTAVSVYDERSVVGGSR